MPAPRPGLSRALGALVVLATVACGDPNGPGDAPEGIQFVAGADVTDTALARPVQPLVVEVRDSTGALRPRTIVRFEAIPAPGSTLDSPMGTFTAYVGGLETTSFWQTLIDTTDSRGRVSARVMLGHIAGPAGIVVTVPELGLADTAHFTVTPVAPAGLAVTPSDTMIFPGASIALHGVVVDRYGNARPEPVTFTAGTAGVSVSGTTLTAHSAGGAWVIARWADFVDTAFVVVAPLATLAANTGTALVTFRTDGSAISTVAPTTHASFVTDWSPDGSEILFDEVSVGRLLVANVATGAVRTASRFGAIYGHFSPDGGTIYYSLSAWRLYRQNRDGTDDGPVPMLSPATDVYPSPSPDGTRLVYVTTFGGGDDHLKLLTLATGATTDLQIVGHAPNWSPAGAEIAFVVGTSGVLKVARADGTNVRTLAPGRFYQRGIDWSPDGKWIVAWNVRDEVIDLIDVATGIAAPLPFTAGWTAPSWKP